MKKLSIFHASLRLMPSLQLSHILHSTDRKKANALHDNKVRLKGRLIGTMLIWLNVLALAGCTQDNSTASAQNAHTSSSKYCQAINQPFSYTLCEVQQESLLEDSNLALKLYWREGNNETNKDASPLFTFNNLKQSLANNQHLLFANNAGMYNDSFAPIGYTVINGQQVLSLNLKDGSGNFHLMPNGVFWWDDNGFYITESKVMSNMLQSGTKPKYASQSGPMLVINGELHPEFKADSPSKKIRNGVGVCENGMIKFVSSHSAVNFHEFATLYKDSLSCDNALFFDGGIASAVYAPALQREDKKKMGVMVALVETDTTDETNQSN